MGASAITKFRPIVRTKLANCIIEHITAEFEYIFRNWKTTNIVKMKTIYVKKKIKDATAYLNLYLNTHAP